MASASGNTTAISGKPTKAMNRLRIIVLGYIIRGPVGGNASCHLQYVLGLAHLGHVVYFVEDSDDYPSCYDPSRHTTDTDPSYGLRFATYAFKRLGLNDRWAYYDAHTSRWFGPCSDRILGIFATSDLLLNVGGVNPLRSWCMKVPERAFVDLDPVFTQIRHLTDAVARNRALQHTSFFSIGENIGLNHCSIPNDGIRWQRARQPIVLDMWPVTPAPEHGKYTTVMLWESYPAREYNGFRYGMKSDSFEPYLDFPRKAGRLFELAVGSPSAPYHLIRNNGWMVRNPLEVTRDPWTYQRYIQQSKAEFSVAKQGYVVSQSGWFSDRSAAYLASSRPVLIQETGFSDWLQTGYGVIPFNSPDEALTGVEEINGRYEFHCRAARAVAAEYFDARKVLPRMIERAMNSTHSPATDG